MLFRDHGHDVALRHDRFTRSSVCCSIERVPTNVQYCFGRCSPSQRSVTGRSLSPLASGEDDGVGGSTGVGGAVAGGTSSHL